MMGYYVSYLEAALDGTRLDPHQVHSVHEGRPVWVRYDLAAVRRKVSPSLFASRAPTLWRYRELLPLPPDYEPVTLGEGMTPLLEVPRLGELFGLRSLWVKDESQLPGGTFKSRGMAMAMSMARRFGVKRVAVPTAGNAGGAAAAYAARAAIEAYVFMPEDTPIVNQYEVLLAGGRGYVVPGLITDCAQIVRQGAAHMGWFDLSTLREPYRLEGKKTMGLELAEQFGWTLPDVILYPTGGGTGLIGMWKAFQELCELGWLRQDKLPRLVAVQSDGCAPIVQAFVQGKRFADPPATADTIARGIRVPTAIGDFMIIDAVRQSEGCAVAVPEQEIPKWMRIATQTTGILICPETAACVGALQILSRSGWLRPDERIILFNTGSALKYVEAIQSPLPRIDPRQPIDWQRLTTTA